MSTGGDRQTGGAGKSGRSATHVNAGLNAGLSTRAFVYDVEADRHIEQTGYRCARGLGALEAGLGADLAGARGAVGLVREAVALDEREAVLVHVDGADLGGAFCLCKRAGEEADGADAEDENGLAGFEIDAA